ncbi:MAG: hypothetical protein QOD49_571 [Actinomycetota bacterium]|nr:hypothetical protein [Actinomycetota bacterium]
MPLSDTIASSVLLTRTPVRLEPDPSRVLATLFMPGEEMPEDHSRATAVLDRVMALSDDEVAATLADLSSRFAGRHRDLDAVFRRHFDVVASRLASDAEPSDDRRRLIGAYFTHEEATEGAAFTNPSMVEHPDQSGLGPGQTRFVLSARAVGEGHTSVLEFRTGVIGADLQISLNKPRGRLISGQPRPTVYERDAFHALLAELGSDDETAQLVLGALGPQFDAAELDRAVAALDRHVLSRTAARETVGRIGWLAANNYDVSFPDDTAIDQRVLTPTGSTESHGIEDARLVRFVNDDGSATYYATYTAYDGSRVQPQLLATSDFRTFRAHQLSGTSARNKGMALFPRRIGGRYVSLSRWDRESISLASSDDLWSWGPPTTVQRPEYPWDLIQMGNCGSPIETSAGWLVLTHGVGPMRTYAIGATLLDLDDPSRLVATLPEPLVTATPEERDGYVPNVVYTCGGMVHGEALVLPYGYGDRAIGIALVDLPTLLDRLRSSAR